MWLWKYWILFTSCSVVSVSLNSTLDCLLFPPFVSVDARSIKNTRPIKPGILVNMIGLSSKSELMKTCHFGLLLKQEWLRVVQNLINLIELLVLLLLYLVWKHKGIIKKSGWAVGELEPATAHIDIYVM